MSDKERIKQLEAELRKVEAERNEYSTALAMICDQPPKYAKPIAEAALRKTPNPP